MTAGDGDAEGLPTVLCEAQAMGLPVAAFQGGGTDEAVASGQTALLVPQRDEQALAEAILCLLTNDALHARLGTMGRKRAFDVFDIHKQTGLLEEQYDEVVTRAEHVRR